MSNETGLDWLARNVHVWNESAYAAMCGGVERVLWISGAAYGQKAEFKNAVTKDQWLARRAELQNKPGWDDAPEWAEWLAQDPCGEWWFYDAKPCGDGSEWDSAVHSDSATVVSDGAVLGSWRDTLEKRPEEFKQFTSIEDNQDREGANQKLNELEMLGKVSHLISDKRHRITTSKYTKTIHGVPVDVYDVLQAWGVINPALQHLIKKALQCGQRGHKDNAQDLQDIIDSAIRAKELG